MLTKRIITSLILFLIVIWGIFFATGTQFYGLTGIIFMWAAFEWTRLMDMTKSWKRILFLIFMLLMMVTLYHLQIQFVLTFALLCWMFSIFSIIRYPQGTDVWNKTTFFSLYAVMVLAPCWIALMVLRNEYHGYLLLYLLLLVWSADVGAYFCGQYWGKMKLAPSVSPGKSIEGVIGGLAAALIIAFVAAFTFSIPVDLWPLWILLATITVLMSVVGDLFISMLKRNCGLKDTGKILPGHGGLLDRLDSLTAAAPVFLLGIIVSQIPLNYISI